MTTLSKRICTLRFADKLAWKPARALSKPSLATFTEKTIVDATTSTTGYHALSFDSRDGVDAITRAAVAAGGRELHEPRDMGFMYSRAFEDLDGHGFGPFGWTAVV